MIKRETLTISLPPKLLHEVRETAQKTGMTQSEFFRNAARRFFAERETLDILLDRKTHKRIIKSLREARRYRGEPIESIL